MTCPLPAIYFHCRTWQDQPARRQLCHHCTGRQTEQTRRTQIKTAAGAVSILHQLAVAVTRCQTPNALASQFINALFEPQSLPQPGGWHHAAARLNHNGSPASGAMPPKKRKFKQLTPAMEEKSNLQIQEAEKTGILGTLRGKLDSASMDAVSMIHSQLMRAA